MVLLEVALHPGVVATSIDALRADALATVAMSGMQPRDGQHVDLRPSAALSEQVRHIRVFCDDEGRPGVVAPGTALSPAHPIVHVHQVFEEEPAEETTEGDDDTVAFQLWTLRSLSSPFSHPLALRSLTCAARPSPLPRPLLRDDGISCSQLRT